MIMMPSVAFSLSRRAVLASRPLDAEKRRLLHGPDLPRRKRERVQVCLMPIRLVFSLTPGRVSECPPDVDGFALLHGPDFTKKKT